MQKLKLLLTGAVLTLGFGISGPAMAATATHEPQTVSLNGGTDWTPDGGPGCTECTSSGGNAGDSVTVAPGATITVELEVLGDGATDWSCTRWTVDSSTGTDKDPAHVDLVGPETETFNITAPAVTGTYDLFLEAFHNNGCNQDFGTINLVDAVVVEATAAEDLIHIEKTLLNGPLDDAAAFMDTVDDQPGQNLEMGSFDAGAIWIGLDETQRYKFMIEITNNTGSALNDTVGSDVVPAEFNLDPGLHEDDFDGGIDGACPTGSGGTCDGDTDGDLGLLEKPGYESDSGACVVTHSQPDSASKPEPPEKQPEFFTILIDGLADAATCTITVYVMTDENPGDGESPDYEPTSCRQIAIVDGIPINDTLTLNEGVKVFQIEPANGLPAHGERLFGPVSSLQLTVNGCDADGDGVQDLEDACPLEGPPDTGAGETLDGDGCIILP
jgi:hypothetical protein